MARRPDAIPGREYPPPRLRLEPDGGGDPVRRHSEHGGRKERLSGNRSGVTRSWEPPGPQSVPPAERLRSPRPDGKRRTDPGVAGVPEEADPRLGSGR